MNARTKTFFVAILYVASFSFAQAALYAPGATLDPSCGPTDLNCGVESVVGAGTVGQIPYYAADGSVLSASSNFTVLGNANVNGSIWSNQYTESSNSQYNPGSNALNGQSDGTSWAEAGTDALPVGTSYPGALVYDGKMWIIGGATNGGDSRKVYYSTDGATWTEAGTDALPVATEGGASLVYNGKMWLIGGWISNNGTRKVYYSTNGATWTEAGTDALPVDTYGEYSYVFNGKMWIAGGWINGGNAQTRKVYYSTNGVTWTEAGTDALPLPMDTGASLVYGGKMWIIGGETDTSLAHVYSTTDGVTWSDMGALPTPVNLNNAVVYNGKIWVIGGWTGSSGSQKIYSSTDGTTWSEAGTNALPGPIRGQASLVYNGRIWNIGGFTGSNSPKVYYSTPTVHGGFIAENTVTSSGAELVTNGTFTGSAAGWTLGSDAAYSSNHVTSTYAGGDPQVSTTFSTVAGHTYLLTFNTSSANNTVYYYFDNDAGSYNGGPFSNGTTTVAFTSTFTGTETIHFDDTFYITGDTWTLDNVSIKEITAPTNTLTVTGFNGNKLLSLGGDLGGNLALGESALEANTSGGNTALGTYTLTHSTTGSANTAVGFEALYANTTGFGNTASGYSALNSNTTGGGNAAFGLSALLENTTGNSNTALGISAGKLNVTGSYNTFLGSLAGSHLTGGDGNIAIGYNVAFASTTGSHQLAIGSYLYGTNINSLANGALGIGTSTPWRNLSVAGSVGFSGLTGASGAGSLCLSADNEVVYNSGSDSCLPSLRSLKHDISILQLSGTSTIMALDPVSFIYNYDASNTVRYGFIAEDTSKVDAHLGTYDIHGNLSGVDDRSLIAILVKAVKEVLTTMQTFSESFTSKKVTATEEICVGSTCVTEAQFKTVFGGTQTSTAPVWGASPSSSQPSDSTTTTSDTATTTQSAPGSTATTTVPTPADTTVTSDTSTSTTTTDPVPTPSTTTDSSTTLETSTN